MCTLSRHQALVICDTRYEALARMLPRKHHRRSSYGWALSRLRQRWARERARLTALPPDPFPLALNLLPCAPSLADPDPNAHARWVDDGGACHCPECE